MLLAYIDEFGHIGPYISEQHPKFKTHPVFGYGGFVVPADSVRQFGGFFEHQKASLLAFEIEQAGAHPRRWEKKGASLLTTRNIERYGAEIRPTMRRLARRLTSLGGAAFFFGQEKPIGSATETGESATKRSIHNLYQTILRLSRHAAKRDERLMIFMDAVDSAPRLDAVAAMGGFIYTARYPELRRVVEIPMQVESHLYGTTQYADWLCALYSRASHFHMVEGSQYGWAPAMFRDQFGEFGACALGAAVQVRKPGHAWLRPAQLALDDAFVAQVGAEDLDRDGVPAMTQRVGDADGRLAAFYATLAEK